LPDHYLPLTILKKEKRKEKRWRRKGKWGEITEKYLTFFLDLSFIHC